MSTRLRALFAVACALVAIAAVVASAAPAAAPGKNGGIAFRRYFDQQQTSGAVFTVSAGGEAAKQVTRPPAGVVDDQPEWAPDGSLIAFTRCAQGAICHVFVIAPDGTGLAPVGPLCPTGANEQTCPDDEHASFSPDSKVLALVQATGTVKADPSGGTWIEHSALALLNVDGGGRHVVYQAAPFSGDLGYPVFSPDGKQLVFERTASGFTKQAGKNAVFVIGVDGSDPRRLTPWAESDGDNPDWSPDGKWILFHSHLEDPSHQSQIFLIHPDGSGRKQLTHFSNGTHVASSTFSPDGKWIAISKGPEGGNIDVYVMRVDGTHMRRVTRSKLWESAPDWGPR
jgi:TolB protein